MPLVACIMAIFTFSVGHICLSPYSVATRLLASAGPVPADVVSVTVAAVTMAKCYHT